MNKKEKVTICIPVYNGETTISDSINSALSQTYDNLEILVIDNQSTDCTMDEILKITDERLVVFQNDTNVGMAGNWNECLKKASGEYIHFLCADDFLTTDCIQKKMDLMSTDEEIVMVISSTDIINEQDELVMRRKRHSSDKVFLGTKYAKKSLHRGNIYGEPSNVLFKKSVLEKTGVFSTNLYYTTDWDLWIRISGCGKIGYVSDSLTKYRISTSNTTSQMKLKKIMQDDKVMMSNLKKQNLVPINQGDCIIHSVVMFFRNIARFMYMKIKSR